MIQSKDIAVGIVLDETTGKVSDASRKAALQAKWLADRTRARVTLLHSTWSDVEEAGAEPSQETLSKLKELAVELGTANGNVSKNGNGIAVTRERPWVALVQRALRRDTDFVFVGRRDRPDDERLLGSTTGKLLRKCPCPVWAVAPESELLTHMVLAATDLTDVGALATRLGATLAAMAGAELHIVHAWQKTMAYQLECARLDDEEIERRVEAREAELRERILDGLAGDQATVTPLLHVGCTTPSRAILEGVDALHPDLLVMGTLSRTGVPGLLVGNTAELVLERVACSLLAVKPPDFVSPVGS